MTDKQLIALATKASAGDEGAFEKLYAEHVRSILFHVRSLIIDKENCYDVAQDAVLKMFTNIHQLRNPEAFRGWMHQVIRTTCAEHNRTLLSKGRPIDSEEAVEELEAIEDEDTQVDPEAVTMAKLEGNQLFAMISELPEHYREILAQRYYDDLSYKEISEILGISMSNVGMRLQRATDALRKQMGEVGKAYFAPDKGTDMKDAQKDIPGGSVKDTGNTASATPDTTQPLDNNIKTSFNSGIAMLFPSEPVGEFLTSTNAKIASLAGTAAGAGATSTTATASVEAAKPGIGTLFIALGTIVVIAALVVGAIAINTQGNNAENTPVETAQQPEPEAIDYSGTMRLGFVDEDGNDSSRNVVAAILVEDEPAAAEVSWALYAAAEESAEDDTAPEQLLTPLANGSGHEVDSTVLANLEPGYYLLTFTLIDENNATAEVKRNFTIE